MRKGRRPIEKGKTSSFSFLLSFFRTKTRISKRNELTKSIKLEYQSARREKAVVGVPPSRNETASRGTGRKGKGREIKRFTCSTTATRGFARFGLRSRGTRFIHGERKERETEERNGLARVVEDRGGAVGGIVFRRFDRSSREAV